jgi:hypothetical protein
LWKYNKKRRDRGIRLESLIEERGDLLSISISLEPGSKTDQDNTRKSLLYQFGGSIFAP